MAANEETKAKKKRTAPAGDRAVRLPEELLGKAEALIPMLQATPWGAALRWSETAVLRLALARGLAQLAEDLETDGAGLLGPTKRKGKA